MWVVKENDRGNDRLLNLIRKYKIYDNAEKILRKSSRRLGFPDFQDIPLANVSRNLKSYDTIFI